MCMGTAAQDSSCNLQQTSVSVSSKDSPSMLDQKLMSFVISRQ